jgi:hypothetical protein
MEKEFCIDRFPDQVKTSIRFYIWSLNKLLIQYETGEISLIDYTNAHEELIKKSEEMYQDEIEAAIIKNCATDSTSAAHNFSVFRDQIIEAFDQGVIAEFTHQVTGAPETSGQEYFNQTYGDGIQ